MTTSASAAIAATPAASQPSQSARVEQVADQRVGPQADRQRDQHAERAEEDARRAASGGAGRSPAAVRAVSTIVGSSKTSISAGITIATSDLAIARGLRASRPGACAPARAPALPRLAARCGMLRVCAVRSCQPVSDQELQARGRA